MPTNREIIQSAINALAAKQGIENSVDPSNLTSDQLQVMLDNLVASDELPVGSNVIMADMAKNNLTYKSLPLISANVWQKMVPNVGGTLFDSTEAGNTKGMTVDLANSRITVGSTGIYNIKMLTRGSIDASQSDFVISFCKYTGTEPNPPGPFSLKTIGEFSVISANETYQVELDSVVPLTAGDILIPIVTSNATTNMTINNCNILIQRLY